MPLPMVHLAVAVQVCSLWASELAPEFLLGSIAPDAIHMRSNAGRKDKQHVHLEMAGGRKDHEAIQALLVQHWTEKSALVDFVEGYAVHLLTDRMWLERVIGPIQSAMPGHLSAKARRSLYYQETDQVDFNLYRQAPWRPAVWTKLAAAHLTDFSPLLNAEEIEKWRDRILRWFEELKEEPGIEPVYFTDAIIQAFIGRAAEMIAGQLLIWDSAK